MKVKEKIYSTHLGDIHYWINDIDKDRVTLVFLPGLTADHRLFGKQIEYFENILDEKGNYKTIRCSNIQFQIEK